MNKYEQALEILSFDTTQIQDDVHLFNILNAKRYCETIIQEFVDKATPTEVEGLSITYEGLVGNCPYCGEFVVEWSDKPDICECGQKFIWKGGTYE